MLDQPESPTDNPAESSLYRWWRADYYALTPTSRDAPHVIVARHPRWGEIRDRILDKKPQHPVRLIIPFKNLMGYIIRSYEFDLIADDYEHLGDKNLHDWEQFGLRCRIGPEYI